MISQDLIFSQYAAQIQEWIGSCDPEKIKCNQPPSKVRPKRLIYFNHKLKIARLVCIRKMEDLPPYVALSYVWGKKENYRTTLDNLETHKGPKGIPEDGLLPQTIKDVFEMVRRLDFSYLWIDALCIVQGERGSEWETECKNMGDMYANAALVISAMASPSAHSGLLGSQSCYSDEQKRDFHTIMKTCRTMTQEEWKTKIKGTHPLLCRAWGFQERLLSRKIVHFTDVGLVWECLESRYCGCDLKSDHQELQRQINNLNTTLRACRDPGISKEKRQLRCRLMWRECVKSCTRRELTVKKDRLPAIEGIASYIRMPGSDDYPSKYLQGLWEDCLPWELLWYCDQTSGLKPEKFRPSFSWSSVDCGIEWPTCHDGRPPNTLGIPRSWPACQLDQIIQERESVAISTGTCFEFSLEDKITANRTPYICKVTVPEPGKLTMVTRTTPVWIPDTGSSNMKCIIRKKGSIHSLPFYPDIIMNKDMLGEGSTFTYVEIASLTDAKNDFPLFQAGLVVRPTSKPNEPISYERIGMAGRISCSLEQDGLNWSTGDDVKEITLN
jgi:hypothetical protein